MMFYDCWSIIMSELLNPPWVKDTQNILFTTHWPPSVKWILFLNSEVNASGFQEYPKEMSIFVIVMLTFKR